MYSSLKTHLFILIFLCAGINIIFSQGQNTESLLRKANHNFQKKNYNEAIPLYLEVEKNMPSKHITEPDLYYHIAYSYYSGDFEKEKSVPYFLKYMSLTDTVYEPHYFLGKVYQFLNKNDEALEQYAKFKHLVEKDSSVDKETINSVLKVLNRQITTCKYGKFMVMHPIKALDQNLGDTINTKYSEYAPVINNLEEKLVFTRRSPQTTGGHISPDGDYFEDVYSCDILEGRLMHNYDYDSTLKTGYQNMLANLRFSFPANMGKNINSSGHEGGVAFSTDAKKLFIYKDLRIWEAIQENGVWQISSEIEGLSKVVNKNSYEPSISLSVDEKEAYISCEQLGGYGGLDLYKSVKVNGVWSPAVNLGPQINTNEDEDSPYIDPDGKKLYFSSKGHSSMGGFDIFKSEFDGKNWSIPTNLGYPVNSAADDIFFIMPLRYNRGYYSSDKLGGHGKMDIYRVTFSNERPSFAEIRGLVLKGDYLVPAYSKISMLDPFTQEPLENHESDSASGNYLIFVPHGMTNLMRIETPGFSPVIREFTIPPQVDFFQFYQEIQHVYIRDKTGNIIGQQVSLVSTENNSQLTDSLRENNGRLGKSYFKNGPKNDSTYRNIMTDVKFYYPEDSILKMIKTDTTILKQFPSGTQVSFASSKAKHQLGNGSNSLPEAYSPSTNFMIDKNTLAIVLTPKVTPDTLQIELTDVNNIALSSKISPDSLAKSFKTEKLDKKQNLGNQLLTPYRDTIVPKVVVFFAYNQSSLSGEFLNNLITVVNFMKKNTTFYFEISGHTDGKGSKEYNLRLSLERAQAVKKFMMQNGIPPQRLTAVGKGEGESISPNENLDGGDNPEGRQKNRRIEFRMLKK